MTFGGINFGGIKFWRSLGAQLLSCMLVFAPSAGAQQPAAPAQAKPIGALPTTENLKILVLAGQREANDLQRGVMAPLVVQVLDQGDNPIEGAEVGFRFPASGPGAFFEGQKTSGTVRSNAEGQARATGWTANNQTGNFQVHVTATLGSQMGQTNVSMSNLTRVTGDQQRARNRRFSKKAAVIVIIAAAAAAGTVAGILLTRSSGSSSTTTVTISPGGPTLGGPH